MEQSGRTLLAKIWEQHVIARISDDTDLLHVDRHLLHDPNALGRGFVLMLCCDYRLVADDGAPRFGLTEARAGVPFPAGPITIMKHEMPAGLLRQMTLSSRLVSPQDLVQHGLVDLSQARIGSSRMLSLLRRTLPHSLRLRW